MNLSHLKSKLQVLLGAQLTGEDVHVLLREVVANGGGVTIDLDDIRYRLVSREGKFGLKVVERRRTSTIPPF